MIITSEAELQSSPVASTAVRVATLGISDLVRSSSEAKAERTDPTTALMDMRLTGQVRAVLEREFQAAVPGTVLEDARFKVRIGKQERQWTLVRMPASELVLLQIPWWILKDGGQINNLDILLYALRGKTARVFSPNLPGEPSSWFNGLKRNWEEDEKTYIDYISQSSIAELETGEGDLENVMKLNLKASASTSHERTADATAPTVVAQTPQLRTIRIFLASSAELREERDQFELYFRQLNDELRDRGLYLEIDRWENFIDAMAETRLQDKYNKAVMSSDIFVSLFFTKTGKYTEEEFDTAYGQFRGTGRPYIYTFFKSASVNVDNLQEKDLQSLRAFQKKLTALGHFQTSFDSIDNLKLRFRDQLDKLLAGPLADK